ncbi:rRNA (guanine-N1)-methyltransferase, partial [Streptococcus suis]
PLFFQVDQSKLDLSQLTEITVEGVLLIGRI